jgi:hypothetical protein
LLASVSLVRIRGTVDYVPRDPRERCTPSAIGGFIPALIKSREALYEVTGVVQGMDSAQLRGFPLRAPPPVHVSATTYSTVQ